jgi:Holliday junction DNA helicase RuvA
MIVIMIGKLSGKTVFKDEKGLILDVSGVGYKIYVMEDTLNEVKTGEELTLWTHLSVKEDALDLYGFNDRETLEFFTLLITIPGIGPKSALGILSIAPYQTLEKAITSGNTSYLTKVSGIGRKSADKIVLELKDKLSRKSSDEDMQELQEDADALLALKSLGYRTNEAREALKKVPENISGTSERIKAALKVLSK